MKYVVLLASLLIQVCLGGLYAWSSLVPSLQSSFGYSMAQCQLVFGVLIGVFTISMVPAGRLLQRWGPAKVAGIGGLLFGAGYLLASLSNGSFPILFLGIAGLAGAGTGFGYVCPLSTCVRWFPNHRGAVTGLAVAGFGLGAVLLSGLVHLLFEQGLDVLSVLRWTGVTYGALIVVAAGALRNPDSTSSGQAAPGPEPVALPRDPFFAALVLGMFCGTFAGLLVVGNLKPLTLSLGGSYLQAMLSISAFALGNAAGRVTWGWLSDGLGQRGIPLSLACLAASLALLGLAGWWTPGLVAATFLVGFNFGACFVVYAAQVASRFGAEGIGTVYPLVFLAYGAAGVLGPLAGGWIYDATSTYSSALGISLAVVLAGLGGGTWLLARAVRADRLQTIPEDAES